ncbi:MAG: hypothetical protein ACTSQJ_15605 [Promethearchaeota archaeon]
MAEVLKEKIKIIHEYFKDFSNFIEVENFRAFLLFTLTSQVPSNILAQFGLGGTKEVINLPYNPLFKIYYQKINLVSLGNLIVYVKRDPLTDKFVLEKDDPIFKEYLNPNEISLGFRGKEKILFPKICDCSSFHSNDNIKLTIKIDDMFYSLESFMAIIEPNILFIIDGNESEPDLLFAFNMMPEIPTLLEKKSLKIDVYFDPEHLTKDKTYLKREENYKLEFMKDIKEISHAELYKSSFSLLLHIKSFNKPY